MQEQQFYSPLKIVSFVVLLAMAGAIIYAFVIAVKYWNGIGV